MVWVLTIRRGRVRAGALLGSWFHSYVVLFILSHVFALW